MGLEFTSTQGEDLPENTKLTFKLDGVEFTAQMRNDADSILEYSEMMGTASDDVDVNSPEGVAFVARYYKLILGPAEYRRFRAHLKSHKTKQAVLQEIMAGLHEELQQSVEAATDLPTRASSHSSAGATARAERRLEIISQAARDGADVVFAGDGDAASPRSA